MMIAAQVIEQENLPLDAAAETFAKVGQVVSALQFRRSGL